MSPLLLAAGDFSRADCVQLVPANHPNGRGDADRGLLHVAAAVGPLEFLNEQAQAVTESDRERQIFAPVSFAAAHSDDRPVTCQRVAGSQNGLREIHAAAVPLVLVGAVDHEQARRHDVEQHQVRVERVGHVEHKEPPGRENQDRKKQIPAGDAFAQVDNQVILARFDFQLSRDGAAFTCHG